MRGIFDGIKESPHPEEAAEQLLEGLSGPIQRGASG
jgi:hypothetical protein